MIETAKKQMTEEEYIQFELKSERRHEYINGQLFEMPGEKKINNRIAGRFYLLLVQLLGEAGFQIYNHDVKVAIPGGNKYYYPDVCGAKEGDDEANPYVIYNPVLVIEVVSEGSHKHDYIDKYIDYTTIPSLQYYIIAEPEAVLITVFEREDNNWVSHKYTALEDTIQLPKLNIGLPMSAIYKDTRL